MQTALQWKTASLILISAWIAQGSAHLYSQDVLKHIIRPRFQHFGTYQGLSQNSVTCMIRDRQGFLWIGTEDGLNRFDGYEFKVYEMNPHDPTTLGNDSISTLYEDSAGNLWVGTRGELHWIDAKDGQIYPLPQVNGQTTSYRTTKIHEDPKRGLWCASLGNGLKLIDPKTKATLKHYLSDPNDPRSLSSDVINYILPASHLDGLWIATDEGLSLLNHETSKIQHFGFLDQGYYEQNGSQHYEVQEYPKGTLWIGTGHGLLKFDYQEGSHTRYEHVPGDPTTMSVSMAYATLPDVLEPDYLWVATVDGLNRLHIPSGKFHIYRNDPTDQFSLADNLIFSLYDDGMGSLWIGTYGNGLNLLRKEMRAFNYIPTNPRDEDGLNIVMSVARTSNGELWCGTLRGGLLRYSPDGKRERYDTGILPTRTVSVIYEHAPDDLWLGTQEGLIRMNPQKPQTSLLKPVPGLERRWVTHIRQDLRDPDMFWIGASHGLSRFELSRGTVTTLPVDASDPTKLPVEWVSALATDSLKPERLWLGSTTHGLALVDTNSLEVKRYPASPNDDKGPINPYIVTLLQDRSDPNILWVGTYAGLSRMVKDQERFTHLLKSDGMASDLIYAIEIDKQGHLWLSTTRGISHYNPQTGFFKNYDIFDGLQNNEFNANASMQDRDGRIFFGGIRGVSSFIPDRVVENTNPPIPMLTQFLLANKDPGLKAQNPASPLTMPINRTKQLTLGPQDNVFSFRFSAAHFANVQRNQFAYRLEGFNDEWTLTDTNNRIATYTNLPSGSYQFQVKAANRDGHWSADLEAIDIHILPPLWQTWWAYCLYGLTILTLLFLFYRMQAREIRSQKAIADTERQVNQRLRQLDTLKDEFLANTSHELRTPLNGIIGLADSLAHGATGELPKDTRLNLNMIAQSARRLSRLVNDILDFAKLRNRNLELNLQPLDVHMITDLVLTLSRPLINKEPQLHNKVPQELTPVLADADRLQQVLHNLVGNAIKFTDDGEISVGASQVGEAIEILVTDTGIGIPNDKLETIFESFEQVDGTIERNYGGTGLGLAITRKLVELMGGSISVASTVGEGSTFRFTLPTAKATPESPLPEDMASLNQPQATRLVMDEQSVPLEPKLDEATKFCILVVDDEPVNRQVVSNYLKSHRCTILQAESGSKALDLMAAHPEVDLVLLDVMMPRMSGYEVCRRLRETYPVHELPIIFLTARNQVNDLTEGFNAGANDFIVKPISKGELLSRVSTHLQLVDINRNLEERVRERTNELSQRNEEIVRAQKHLIMQEKMAFLGTLAAGMAHEIRNPLNIVKNLAEVCQELAQELVEAVDNQEIAPEDLKPMAQDLATNTHVMTSHGVRMDRIIHHLMEFARERKSETQELDIAKFVSTYVQLAAHGHPDSEQAREIQFDIKAPTESCSAEVLPSDLSRAVINLVNNAIDAILEKRRNASQDYHPRIDLRVEREEERIKVVIQDNGIGMTPETRDKALTPFFTRKIGERHIGLGLPISYDIITQGHGGNLNIESHPGMGTSVSFTLYAKKP